MPRKIETFVPGGGRIYAKLAMDVGANLSKALRAESKSPTNMTKAKLADLVGRDKSFVTRSMSGSGNLTLRTIAALLAALGYEMEVSIHRIDAVNLDSTNHRDQVKPEEVFTTSGGFKTRSTNTSNVSLTNYSIPNLGPA